MIVRLNRGGSAFEVGCREVQAARWFAREGVPASRALEVDQPIVATPYVATFWAAAADNVRYGSAGDLGRLLRRLHALAPPDELDLPQLDPFAQADRYLARNTPLQADDYGFLRARLADLQMAFVRLEFVLAPGVIHGDASVGNVILGRAGAPLLVDLDGLAIGPREWDLVPTAMYSDRFRWHSADEYATFVDAVGFDVRQWPGYTVLADLREALMLLWLASTADDEAKVAELRKPLAALRTGGSRRDWQPY